MSRILFISSEAFPLVKTGGLGDVAGSLPAALLKEQQNVRLLVPAYQSVLSNIEKRKVIAETSYYDLPVTILETRLPGTKVITWLVDCPALYDRPGGPYGDIDGQPWSDNARRFAVLCHAAVDLALDRLGLDWRADVVHANDWQTGLVPALLSLQADRPLTVFTIHNLAYQGVFDKLTFAELALPEELWSMQGLEFYDQLSFIKGGIAYADKITTVSPTYAKEIQQPECGYGLHGLLHHRGADLQGILNGIDPKYWNPGTDIHLSQKYNRQTLDKKSLNKTALQQELGLPVDAGVPLLGMISRLVEQKGLDILLQSLPALLTESLQVVILGSGEKHYQQQLQTLSEQHPERFKLVLGYNESLAHRIEAASDMYLMPSLFEPCGLNQLYSLRYGTLPIVTRVGGLADTVKDADSKQLADGTANGFVLAKHSAAALRETVIRALDLYKQSDTWRQLQLTAMSQDFSWQASARQYLALYQQLLEG